LFRYFSAMAETIGSAVGMLEPFSCQHH